MPEAKKVSEAKRQELIQDQLAQARSYLAGMNYHRDERFDPDGLRTKTIEELRWYIASKNRFQDDGTQITRAEALLTQRIEEREAAQAEEREHRAYRLKLAALGTTSVTALAAFAQAVAHIFG
jgi:hypothetical protein